MIMVVDDGLAGLESTLQVQVDFHIHDRIASRSRL
jgi:hypothetical protein